MIDIILPLLRDPYILAGIVALATFLSAGCIYLIITTMKKKDTSGPERLIGQAGTVIEWTKTSQRVRVQGEIWYAKAQNVKEPLKQGDIVEIIAIQNLVLDVIKKT